MIELSAILIAFLEEEKPGSTNYYIADYIIKHANTLENISTLELAKACNVSKSSISRFCRAIGLDDFFSLKAMIKNYYPGKSIPEKYSFEKISDDDVSNFIEEYILKINRLKNTLNRNDLIKLVDDIYHHQNIYLMGMQQSMGIITTLQNDLLSLNKHTSQVILPKKQKEILEKATKDDLVIVFSATNSFFDRILPRTNNMNRKDIPKIYLITVSHKEIGSYIHQRIELDNKYNFASNLLLNFYASISAIEYRSRYHK